MMHGLDMAADDFGEPNPAVVPRLWVEQFRSIDPRAGITGSIDDH